MHRSEAPFVAAALAASLALAAHDARAVDAFEIQVYETDVAEPGQPALELHTNYTAKGAREPAYEGEVPAHRAARMTLEPAIGVFPWLELGGYLQTLVAPDVGARFAGAKVRAKLVVPASAGLPVGLGLNIELGRVPRIVEENGWANELRPIFTWQPGPLRFALNPIVGYELSGPDRLRPYFEPAAKAAFDTRRGFSLGAEYYAGLGYFGDGLAPRAEQEHTVYAVFDRVAAPGAPDDGWELNLGVGRALTDATASTWTAKAIFGRAF